MLGHLAGRALAGESPRLHRTTTGRGFWGRNGGAGGSLGSRALHVEAAGQSDCNREGLILNLC